jgi:hypothetical protein
VGGREDKRRAVGITMTTMMMMIMMMNLMTEMIIMIHDERKDNDDGDHGVRREQYQGIHDAVRVVVRRVHAPRAAGVWVGHILNAVRHLSENPSFRMVMAREGRN